MENKINIAEILRDCPKGTKLYSPLYGKCKFERISNNSEFPVVVHSEIKTSPISFTKYGHYLYEVEDADCVLFPSDKMRCWSKFFKRGDVVVDEDSETMVVFDGWANDDYTEFNTTINYDTISKVWDKEDICRTVLFHKATDEERAEFITAAEKHYGGKYNPETLQVEPAKVAEPQCPFEPFQKVLVRDNCYDKWKADYFSHYDKDSPSYPYFCMSDAYNVCVAYEGNEHLLGTDAPF